MHWNEKIDVMKKTFSDEEFSVPHIDRKRILIEIENKFIARSYDYYSLNNHSITFGEWWDNIDKPIEINTRLQYSEILDILILPNEDVWIAAEFHHGYILIYKAKLKALKYLIDIGRTWASKFHLIGVKYDCMFSLNITNNITQIKIADDNQTLKRRLVKSI